MEYRDLTFPAASRERIAAIQGARRRLAFERAKLSPFYKGRLDHVRADHLDQSEADVEKNHEAERATVLGRVDRRVVAT